MNKQLFLLLSLVAVIAFPACRKRTEQPVKEEIETMIDLSNLTSSTDEEPLLEKKVIKF
jgi:hypothetical protein